MTDLEKLKSVTKSSLKLSEGEVRCNVCDGDGIIKEVTESSVTVGTCPHCLGNRKLDWIENVVGKRCSCYGSVFKYDRKTGKVIRVD